jgi:hypothetical protein
MSAIYLAGPYDRIETLQQIAFRLLMHGHTITSRWLLGLTPEPLSPDMRAMIAANDMSDLAAADIFVLWRVRPLPERQGHTAELGAAIARKVYVPDLRILLVGERTENIYDWHPSIEHFTDWTTLLESLGVPSTVARTCLTT